MKNRIFFTAVLLLFVTTIFAQQKKVSSEHAAIQQVIEDETKYFNQRNYEKWAECVAHDPMTYYSWTTPFADEDAVFEAKGWEEVSKAFKGFMEAWPADENLPKKENYQFKVSGDMAYVTFTQLPYNSEETRVLEKKDGKWRILRMEALASSAFQKMHQLYALQRMAGTWEVDMSTYTKEGGGSWKFLGGTMEIKRTPTGIKTKELFHYLNEDGDKRTSEESTVGSMNLNTGKIGMLNSVYYPHSNWMAAYSAVGSFTDEGVLACKGTEVGGNDDADLKMWMDGDLLCWAVDVKNEKGEQVFSSSYKMKRTGAGASAKP